MICTPSLPTQAIVAYFTMIAINIKETTGQSYAVDIHIANWSPLKASQSVAFNLPSSRSLGLSAVKHKYIFGKTRLSSALRYTLEERLSQ